MNKAELIFWIVLSVSSIGYLLIASIDRNKYYRSVGNIGENIVADKLKALGEEFIVENDVHIGGLQIDHLVINHELEICFVIETKLWGGIISGDSHDDYWQQDKGGVVKYLDNPVKQNNYHCRVVRKYYKGYKVYNVVVFIRNKNVPKSRCIVCANDLVDYINRTSRKVSNRGRIGIESENLGYGMVIGENVVDVKYTPPPCYGIIMDSFDRDRLRIG